ncbi:MAG: cobalt-precorrin 5A hydrolase [Desulfobacterales bacterium]|nr:cobalt-precorrin 5A hydrolase [Desulfobacterales bacterium]
MAAPHNPNKGELAIWALTPGGGKLSRRLSAIRPGARIFLGRNCGNPGRGFPKAQVRSMDRLGPTLAREFHNFQAHVFIFSTGIALRVLAPLIETKEKDPAVVLMDERGENIISLLSGHIGGANALTLELARALDAHPVITTATDVNGIQSVDHVATVLDMAIENIDAIKGVNMATLKGERIQIKDPAGLLAPHLEIPSLEVLGPDDPFSPDPRIPKIHCHWETQAVPRETLLVRPRCLYVGMGCNRNTPGADLEAFFGSTLKKFNLSPLAVAALATTQVKADEPGLLALGQKLGLPIRFYDKAALNSVTQIQNPSKMVEKHLGVKSVCEAASILASKQGQLILPKQKNPDITLAVSLSSAPDRATQPTCPDGPAS